MKRRYSFSDFPQTILHSLYYPPRFDRGWSVNFPDIVRPINFEGVTQPRIIDDRGKRNENPSTLGMIEPPEILRNSQIGNSASDVITARSNGARALLTMANGIVRQDANGRVDATRGLVSRDLELAGMPLESQLAEGLPATDTHVKPFYPATVTTPGDVLDQQKQLLEQTRQQLQKVHKDEYGVDMSTTKAKDSIPDTAVPLTEGVSIPQVVSASKPTITSSEAPVKTINPAAQPGSTTTQGLETASHALPSKPSITQPAFAISQEDFVQPIFRPVNQDMIEKLAKYVDACFTRKLLPYDDAKDAKDYMQEYFDTIYSPSSNYKFQLAYTMVLPPDLLQRHIQTRLGKYTLESIRAGLEALCHSIFGDEKENTDHSFKTLHSRWYRLKRNFKISNLSDPDATEED